jgi:uncharacterized protein (DUF927 family)
MADGPDFSPLSDSEREAAARELTREAEAKAAKPTSPPVDAEPAEVAAARLFGRKPDALWRYGNNEGETAFYVCRYNKGHAGKDFLPLCWFADEDWRSKHWPAPRPLYNLDRIAAQPDEPIVVAEGEKAADAAARIFPEFVATTSCGGANAVAQSDWTPLAGRRVIVWPDNDEAGARYAGEVAAILAALECEVETIDVAALTAIDGGARAPQFDPKGWDAADAIAEWRDLEALRRAAAGLAQPFDPGPAYVSFWPYAMDADGLTIEKEVGRGEVKRTETVWISAPFEVLGECRDPRGSNWGKMLRWRDADGRRHERHVADADLYGDPSTLCAKLADIGLRVDPDGQRDLVRYLSKARVRRRVTVVQRTGWQEIRGQAVFVLPGNTIGPRGGERVILDAAAHGPYETRGSLEDWRDGAAKLARDHALLVLTISAALAGPLLHLAGYEGGGVHFFGPSSIGKTTLLQTAASVWGRGGTTGGYVRTWRATANGLEGAAAGATDTALVLDEVGQVEAREMAAALYSLADGAGKARALRDGSLREPRSWRTLTISSGEVPINAKLIEDRSRRSRAGQLVRMLDIPATRAFGAFDQAGPDCDAAAIAKQCKLAAVSAYGSAGPEFVRRLITEDVTGDDARSLVKAFVVAEVPPRADGQIDRAAQRLGLIMAAGELATKLGVTPWREGDVRNASAWALAQWIERRGGLEPAEVAQAIETVRHFIEAHGEARFDNIDDLDARPVSNRAGWRRGAGEDRRWLFPPEVWKQDVCAGLDAQFVACVLTDPRRGMLERGGDGYAKVERIAGRSQRVYAVTPRIFEGSEG